MGERAGELDLEARDVADGKAKHSTERHHPPKAQISQVAEVGYFGRLPKHENEREEEDAGVDVVVERQFPDAPLHCRHHLLGVDGIERDAGTRQDPEKHPRPGEGPCQALLIHTQPEPP